MDADARNRLVGAVVSYVAAAIVLFAIVSMDVLSLAQNPDFKTVYSLLDYGLPYFFGALIFAAISTVFSVLYRGTLAKQAKNTLGGFAVAFIADFLLTCQFTPGFLQPMGIYAFLLVVAVSLYYFLNQAAQSYHQLTFVGLSRFGILASAAVILRFAILAGLNNEVVADVLMFGLIFAAATTLFYPLQYSKGSVARRIGGWIGTGVPQKVTLGILMGLYLLFLRGYLLKISYDWTLIGEWLFIALLMAVIFLRLRTKLDLVSAPVILESWQKHQQNLGFRTTKEFTVLSNHVEAFLSTGKKNDLLVFLSTFLYAHDVGNDQISEALDDLINYRDHENPRFVFSWDLQFHEEERLRLRRKVLNSTIKNLNIDLFGSISGVD